MKEFRKSKPIRVLAKTFSIIEAVQDSPAPLTLKAISEQTAVNKSTASRILAHLETQRYVTRDAKGGYRVGEKLLQLGTRPASEVNLREAAQAPLRELWRITQETVNLGILDGLEVMYLDGLESPQSFRLVSSAGTRAIAYRTALGKAILAYLPAEEREAVITSFAFQPYTPHTIASAEQLRNELEHVRAKGYAIDDEESVIGVRCLAAPVLSPARTATAAVSISGPVARMADDKIEEFSRAARAAAREITERLRTIGQSRLPDRRFVQQRQCNHSA
ncbi:MAG TPA: IclR family transcriptional regulator [Bryobacteraceae bacterium]|nr:IclR family transcriptional regulator [Bryobacteraceae bacterium]